MDIESIARDAQNEHGSATPAADLIALGEHLNGHAIRSIVVVGAGAGGDVWFYSRIRPIARILVVDVLADKSPGPQRIRDAGAELHVGFLDRRFLTTVTRELGAATRGGGIDLLHIDGERSSFLSFGKPGPESAFGLLAPALSADGITVFSRLTPGVSPERAQFPEAAMFWHNVCRMIPQARTLGTLGVLRKPVAGDRPGAAVVL